MTLRSLRNDPVGRSPMPWMKAWSLVREPAAGEICKRRFEFCAIVGDDDR